jgi:uncharacterized protein
MFYNSNIISWDQSYGVMDTHRSRPIDIAIRVAFVIAVSVGIWRWPHAVQVPASFDCTKARLPTEKTICADPDLAKVDADFAIYYADNLAAVAIAGNRAILDTLITGERDFLEARNQCGTSKLCIRQMYDNRDQQLVELVGLPRQ